MLIAVGTRSVTPGKEAEWEALWGKMHDLARQQHGFRTARLLKSVEHTSKYTLIAEWDEREHWDSFYESPDMQELTQASFRLFKGAPVQEWHVIIQEV